MPTHVVPTHVQEGPEPLRSVLSGVYEVVKVSARRGAPAGVQGDHGGRERHDERERGQGYINRLRRAVDAASCRLSRGGLRCIVELVAGAATTIPAAAPREKSRNPVARFEAHHETTRSKSFLRFTTTTPPSSPSELACPSCGRWLK